MRDENEIEMEAMLFEKKIMKDGYIRIRVDNFFKYEHKWVVEQFIGREPTKNEVVHHINQIKSDNRIQNLMLFKNNAEHQKFHIKIKRFKYYTQPMLTEIEHRWDKFFKNGIER